MSISTVGLAELRKFLRASWAQTTLIQLARYTVIRGFTLLITVVVGVYMTILIANMGGYVDQIRKAEIREEIAIRVINDPAMRMHSPEDRLRIIEEQARLEERRLGLDQPFLVRSAYFLQNALTLRLGFAQLMSSDSGSRQVQWILIERLPTTILLFATADLLIFFFSVMIALMLSRNYGSWLDRAFVVLSPLSAAPPWFYGLFLIVIFAGWLRLLPFGGLVDAPPPPTFPEYALGVLKHMILPVSALFISSIFISVYSWRTFFLIYSSEDYVELAKAKGLSGRAIEYRYILRPTLPPIMTNFMLTVISLWMGAPILESVFNWPGMGRTLYQAIGLFDTPVIVGATVIFAYLLAITVFVLDIIYAILDPRVRIGEGGQA
ncbi:MAG: ABC transporter permease [Anaerolineae bacterium]|nr:ABC transporter permease [Thermoflexus sp.]MDW8064780.1 ABC transporter permease [Anaerolineae bacterium]